MLVVPTLAACEMRLGGCTEDLCLSLTLPPRESGSSVTSLQPRGRWQ